MAIDRLEAAGGVNAAEAVVDPEQLEEAHRRYAAFVNARLRTTGHLFQGRFASVVMDEEHLIAAARYVALNPVRGRLAKRAEDWRWSSAHYAWFLAGGDDPVGRWVSGQLARG